MEYITNDPIKTSRFARATKSYDQIQEIVNKMADELRDYKIIDVYTISKSEPAYPDYVKDIFMEDVLTIVNKLLYNSYQELKVVGCPVDNEILLSSIGWFIGWLGSDMSGADLINLYIKFYKGDGNA